MKCFKNILLLFGLVFVLSSCGGVEKRSNPLIDDITTSANPTATTTAQTTTSNDISNDELIKKYGNDTNLILALVDNIINTDRYSCKYEGKTVASVIISYTQEIYSETKRNKDKGYFYTKSSSTFLNVSLKSVFNLSDASYKLNDDEIKNITLKEYQDKYGITPYDKNIVGYNINKDTIREITLKGYKANELYDYRLKLDVSAVSKEQLIEMKEIGSLSSEPRFENIEIEILFNKELKPIKLLLYTEYKVDYGILSNASCTQEITITYIHFNEDFEIETTI